MTEEGKTSDERQGQRRVRLAALAHLEGHGQQADDRSQSGHENRPQANGARGDDRVRYRRPFLHHVVRKLDNEDAIRHRDAGKHDKTHERHDVERRSRQPQCQQRSGNSRRERQQDERRVDERAELRDKHEIQQQHRE